MPAQYTKLKKLLKSFFSIIVFIVLPLFLTPSLSQVYGQFPFMHIANTYPVADEKIEDGDIISLTEATGEAIRAATENDKRMFGVYIESPTLVFRTNEDYFPIVRQGDVYVNVTTLNGPIVAGDYITSSSIAGKGQVSLATEQPRRVVGVALESFSEKNGVKITHQGKDVYLGKVKIALSIGEVNPLSAEVKGGIVKEVNQLGISVLKTVQKPEGTTKIFRYLIAGILAIITVIVSFTTFGRNVTKGIEAIGRNPLAKIQIQSMIVLNVVLIAIVTIGGVILTLVIIKY